VEVLSLAKRIAELERVEAVRTQLLSYCARGVRSAAKSLVEFDGGRVAGQRDLLQLEAVRIEESRTETELRAAYDQVDRILDEHRTEGDAHVRTLRENLNSTARVLQCVLTQIAGSGAAHHDALEADLQRLQEIAAIDEIEPLKRALNETAAHLAERLLHMRREHQLIVTQLRDEIRILHQELQGRAASAGAPLELPEAAAPAPTAGPPPVPAEAPEEVFLGMKRPEFVEVLKVKTEQGDPYSIVVILLSNLAELFARHDPAAVLALMDLSARRVIDCFAGNPFWIRWEDDCFLVCTHFRGSAASAWASDLAERLSGPQPVRTESGVVELPLCVAAAAIDHHAPDTPEVMLQRASDLILSLRSAA
jgi:hypothetical protein